MDFTKLSSEVLIPFQNHYKYQNDNTLNPWKACLATSASMVASFYGVVGDGSQPQLEDQVYKWCLDNGYNPEDNYAIVKYFETKKLRDSFTTTSNWEELIQWFNKEQKPVILGTLLTPRSHMVVSYGYTKNGLRIADPNGKWTPTGYIKTPDPASNMYILDWGLAHNLISPDGSVWVHYVTKIPATPTSTSISISISNPTSTTSLPNKPNPKLTEIYLGGSQSIIAKVIGYVEGNRTIDGGFTNSYYGHTDPGNGASNVGSFSSQSIGEKDPEKADAYWSLELSKYQTYKSPDMTLFEYLNLLDLVIQAPLAVTSEGGYVYRRKELEKAIDSKVDVVSKVANIRKECYRNPRTGRLETTFASEADLLRDQLRRTQAIYDVGVKLNLPLFV